MGTGVIVPVLVRVRGRGPLGTAVARTTFVGRAGDVAATTATCTGAALP